MRLIFVFILTILSHLAVSAPLPSSSQVQLQIEQIESSNNASNQGDLLAVYKSTLHWLNERDNIVAKNTQYENVIDNFPSLSLALSQELENLASQNPTVIENNLSITHLEQRISQASSRLLELSRQIQQEQDNFREIIESINQTPQKQVIARKMLSDAEQRLYTPIDTTNPLFNALQNQLQAEVEARNSLIAQLSLEQLSANNRQELSRLKVDILKKQYEQTDSLTQLLRTQLNKKRQQDAQHTLETTQSLVENNTDLPLTIQLLIETNSALSQSLNQQAKRLNTISLDQRNAVTQTLQVRRALSTLQEQAAWLNMSTALGETLRLQLARLPGKPKPQQLDQEMADIRLQRLNYENQLTKLEQIRITYPQADEESLSKEQQKLLTQLVKTQRELLSALLSGCDSLILELTHLKVSNNQLTDALNEVQETSHRYFFWVADVNPLNMDYPLSVARDLLRLVSLDTLSQLANAFLMMLATPQIISVIIAALIFVIFGLGVRRRYFSFLIRAAGKIGKVNKDNFAITVRTVFWSLMVALPLPVLWAAIGFGLQNAWDYPIAVAIGGGVNAASPILWVFMICATFSHPQGLFIAHFNWSAEKVGKVMRYYQLSIWVVIPLVVAVMSLDTFNDREFAGTLGRLCFILLCIALVLITHTLHKAEIPLQLDLKASGDNLFNSLLWGILLAAPWLAIVAASFGYLTTSEVLLGRLEASVFIWLGLLLIYYIIRRWMLIQKRRIAFERAKQRRAERLAQRAKSNEEEALQTTNSDTYQDIEEPVVDLDVISAQSLQLVRSILTMIGLVSVILLWSELHSAFAFLENIDLWSSKSTSQGVEVVQEITLGSVLIAILVLIITAQLVRNLPALLELAILQHLDLTPGTGYAISTLTKYIILFFGGLAAFSLIGVDWSTLQWLIAALGVGLGFGLQEIFANFISGLIILFEKPIRIGDTVTIRELTGSITKINTRATTLVDWDRKEIIVPNKAFITEQFINWSLSDSVTRIVLTIPATIEADSQLVVTLLKKAAEDCNYVLDTPQFDAFLVDIQEGIQLFELRVFAAEVSHRMPLRNEIHQLILAAFRENNLELPFPPFQVQVSGLGRKNGRRVFSSGGI